MKLALAIADTCALPSAFVVYRGFRESIAKAASLGYDGVELALKTADEVDRNGLRAWLDEAGMEVSCISTGQVFAALGLMCTESDPIRRFQVIEVLQGLIDLAAEFGRMVNLGRVRGSIKDESREVVEDRFVAVARELCDYAAARDVTLVLEPVNRYEIDFINNVEEGVELVRKLGRDNFRLMPDVFHMNIEDVTIGGELARHVAHVAYIHLADSNRLAPGRGHLDFDDLFDHLARAGYDGWVSVEILPKPDPDTAARHAAEFLRPRVDAYNSRLMALRGEPCR
ncbi:MAG TPA: sugar phosphate isomerase/epimerase [Planctomycetaceae bacterium]|nr:sugar phosphate isomerase/epimerase [Planctomycetaceae bacterium]